MAQPAFDHHVRDESDAAEHEHGVLATAQDVAHRTGDSVRRAGASVQTGIARVGQRAQDLAHEANDRIRRLTGHPVQEWPAEAQRTVRAHPVRALAATVGLGYVLGKVLLRSASSKARTRSR